jgi:hypothetical protein
MEAASHVVHRECRAAPLSPELSEQQNFRGLLNLGGLIIVPICARARTPASFQIWMEGGGCWFLYQHLVLLWCVRACGSPYYCSS